MKALDVVRDHDIAKGYAKKLSIEEYHKHSAISKSGLDKINRSPAHYIEYKNNPPDQTHAMRIGSLVHEAILLPQQFKANTVVAPVIDRRTKAGKEEFERFSVENAGKQIITSDDYQLIQGCLDSVYSHPAAGKLLSSGYAEESFFWHDKKTGVECRCRPDFLREGHIIVDVKTTQDASLKAFQRSIAAFRYHVQAAFYLDGLSAVTGSTYDSFVLIAVEKDPPYATAVYILDDATLEQGRLDMARNLLIYAECLKANNWPAYGHDIQPMNLPSWAWSPE